MNKVTISQKFNLFRELWTPKIIGELNGQYVKLVKLKGEFVWHKHDNEDELFLVVKGSIIIKLKNKDIQLNKGEFFIVPKRVEHKPVAEQEAHILLFEPKSTQHTGDIKSELTVEKLEWI